jgi:hypothetical protein
MRAGGASAEVSVGAKPTAPGGAASKAPTPSKGSTSSTTVTSAAAASRGGAGPVRVGQQGEAAVRARYDIGDKAKITVNGRNRIPDGVKRNVLSEVKNVRKLAFTRQLRDFLDFCRERGMRFDLYVRQDVKMTGPLKEAIDVNHINLRYIP